MLGASTFHVPSFWVAAVTAPTDIGLQPGSVALVVRVIEAIETDDASWVLLAILAFPRNIASFERLSTHAKCQVVVPYLPDDVVWIVTVE